MNAKHLHTSFTLLLLLIYTAVPGQNAGKKPVAAALEEIRLQHPDPVEVSPFSLSEAPERGDFESAVSVFTLLKIDLETIATILSDAPEFIRFSFPYEGQTIELELFQKNILSEDFELRTRGSTQSTASFRPGKFYRGIVKGDQESLASISFLENELVGFVSTSALGIL